MTQPAASAEAATARRVRNASTRPRRDVYAELLVEFDDVACAADDQALELPNGDVVTVRVTRGKVTVRQRHRGRKTSAA